jgi:choline dehydrogenase-like flavoprotein
MLIDLSVRRPDLAGTVFDVCIVGGGVAGITLAAKLGALGRRVLLIEAGGREVSRASQENYRGQGGALENLPLHETRIRALGGSSHHWGGWCRPLDAHDFSRSDFSPDGSWPIRKADIDPFFREAAEILDINQVSGADLDLAEADENLGTIRMYFSNPPANLGKKYHDELENAENILLLLNAAFLSANLDERNAMIRSVAVRDPRSPTPVLCHARQFVFAMGAVENARHLLIFNGSRRTRIGNYGGALGKFYMQHLHQELGRFIIMDEQRSPQGASADRLLAFMSSTEKFLRRTGRGAFRLYSTAFACSGLVDEFRRIVTAASCRAASATGVVSITCEQVPNKDSQILLTGEKDDLGQPRVKLDWRIGDQDRTTIGEAAMEFGRYLVGANLGRLKVNPAVLDSTSPLRGWTGLAGAPGAAGHQMGGTRMSRVAEDGVVDADCRLWGLDNLYIAGSGVFRTCGHATPTLTIVQLCLRLAHELDGRLGR